MTASLFLYQFRLGGGWLSGSDNGSGFQSPIAYVAIAFVLAATVVRWVVLPRCGHPIALLVCLIVGLALSETVTFFEIFLFPRSMPQTKMTLFELSVLSTLQFIPLYVRPKTKTSA